jgi:hypothetical protein
MPIFDDYGGLLPPDSQPEMTPEHENRHRPRPRTRRPQPRARGGRLRSSEGRTGASAEQAGMIVASAGNSPKTPMLNRGELIQRIKRGQSPSLSPEQEVGAILSSNSHRVQSYTLGRLAYAHCRVLDIPTALDRWMTCVPNSDHSTKPSPMRLRQLHRLPLRPRANLDLSCLLPSSRNMRSRRSARRQTSARQPRLSVQDLPCIAAISMNGRKSKRNL